MAIEQIHAVNSVTKNTDSNSNIERTTSSKKSQVTFTKQPTYMMFYRNLQKPVNDTNGVQILDENNNPIYETISNKLLLIAEKAKKKAIRNGEKVEVKYWKVTGTTTDINKATLFANKHDIKVNMSSDEPNLEYLNVNLYSKGYQGKLLVQGWDKKVTAKGLKMV